MTQDKSIPPPPRPQAAHNEELCLMGATRMGDFIDFVRERAVGGQGMAQGDLAQLWRDAAAAYRRLETTEAGAADKPGILALPPLLQKHVNKLAKMPNFQSTFAAVPVAFGMVELGKLIASQYHLTRASIDAMVRQAPRPMTDEALAALCLPLTPPSAGFKVAHEDGEKFVFVSDTHDARFLGAKLIDPADIKGFSVNGHAQAVLALSVGFTTNVLNVVRYGNRMALNNGYHRAFALHQMGVTHAPCVIQVCAHWEDVALAGSSELFDNGEVYFSSARPPLLRDFANPALTQAFAARRLMREIRLGYTVDRLQLETISM